MEILGIDPGRNGAMCLLNQYGDILATHIFSAKNKEFDLEGYLMALSKMKYEFPNFVVFLEKVHSMPGQGVASSFKFGRTFGLIQGALSVWDLPLTLVSPRRWTNEIHDDDLDYGLSAKKRSIIMAERLYPGIDLRKSKRAKLPHDGLVDALLIAEYGRRQLCLKKLN